jgi:hypothetical protein
MTSFEWHQTAKYVREVEVETLHSCHVEAKL